MTSTTPHATSRTFGNYFRPRKVSLLSFICGVGVLNMPPLPPTNATPQLRAKRSYLTRAQLSVPHLVSPITSTALTSLSSSTVMTHQLCQITRSSCASRPATLDHTQAAPASLPVIFTANYLDACLAKFSGKIRGPPTQ